MHFLGNMTFEATIPHSVTLIMKQLADLTPFSTVINMHRTPGRPRRLPAEVATGSPGQLGTGDSGELSVNHDGVRALVFDVFGTVVDWRSSVTGEGQKLAKAKGISHVLGLISDPGLTLPESFP